MGHFWLVPLSSHTSNSESDADQSDLRLYCVKMVWLSLSLLPIQLALDVIVFLYTFFSFLCCFFGVHGCFSTCSLVKIRLAKPGSTYRKCEPPGWTRRTCIAKCRSKTLWPLHSVAFQESNLPAVNCYKSLISTIICRAAYYVAKIQHPSTTSTVFRVSPFFPILPLALHSCRPASPHRHAWVAAMWLAS